MAVATERAERFDVKRVLVGRPRATGELDDTLLSKKLALPIFASDPLSSVAYATESGLVVLVAASAAAAHFILPISVAIGVLLGIVVLSYRQTVQAYQTSGGAYVVAKENLGTLPSLVGAAALLVDYVLTVAVSVAAGVLALTSLAPSLGPHKVALSLAAVCLLTLVNLRGVRESGIAFALPTYSFVAVMYVMVAVGIGKCAAGSCPHATVPHPLAAGAGAAGLFVVLRAFASGASALTGVEAISNGVSAFKPPKGRNAAATHRSQYRAQLSSSARASGVITPAAASSNSFAEAAEWNERSIPATSRSGERLRRRSGSERAGSPSKSITIQPSRVQSTWPRW